MSVAEGVIAGMIIAVVAFLFVLAFICSLRQGYRSTHENAATHAAAAAAFAALAANHPPEPTAAGYWDHDEEQEALRRRAREEEEHSSPPRASPTATIPSFTYKPSSATKQNVTDGGEETCSVCLSAFQDGETVRLLPMCLHLYHVECIDPWLQVHSTCPICRSGIDSPVDGGGLLPPV